MKQKPPLKIRVDDLLVLKKISSESAAVIFNAIDLNRNHLRRWLPFVDETFRVSETEMFIKSVLHNASPKKDLVYEIWYDEVFGGLIALKEIDPWNNKTELGYWIIKEFEGQGLVTKSCRALIDLSFNALGLNRVQIKAAPGNARSCLVAERLHFKKEGIEKAGERHRNEYLDLLVYSMLKKDWEDYQPTD